PAGRAGARADARGGHVERPRGGGRQVQGSADRGAGLAPMARHPMSLSAAELARSLREREVTAFQLAEAALQRADDVEGRVHASLARPGDAGREQAAEADHRLGHGEDLPAAAGIPIALKDVLAVKGVPATCGSRILENYRPPYDSTVWSRLSGSGAVLVGKT